MKVENYRQFIDLASDTEWAFIPIGGVRGAVPHRIRMPGGGWYNQGFDCDAGIYERTVSIPRTAYPQVVRIEFEAINFAYDIEFGPNPESLVLLKSGTSSWMPVVVDITDHVRPGETYFLRVTVKGREACSVLKDGHREYTVPEGANWTLTMDSGILRGVRLALYPLTFIDDVFVKTSVAHDKFSADLWVENRSSEKAELEVHLRFLHEGTSQADSLTSAHWTYPNPGPITCILEASERRRISVEPVRWGLGKESYWRPNIPYKPGYRAVLHRVTAELQHRGQTVDVRSDRFGFREFSYTGQYYYLNGIRCNLRGHGQTEADFNGGANNSNDAYGTWPGFLPPSDKNGGWPKAVDNYLRLNANVIRIHQIPATRYMLDVCDEMGLMVIAESSIRGDNNTWTYQHENQALAHDAMCNQVRDMVLRDRNHPSVIAWSLANEVWTGREYQDQFVLELHAIAREGDDTRVCTLDGVLKDYPGDIVPVKHYWPFESLVEWENKPNGIGEYGSMKSVREILDVVIQTIRLRLDGRIVDIRPWHITHAWSAHIPGVHECDVFNEHNSTIYKDIDFGGDFDHTTRFVRSTQTAIEATCKNVKKTVDPSVVLDDDEPWDHPLIRLLQKMFNPLAAFDRELWNAAKVSDDEAAGKKDFFIVPQVKRGETVERTIAVFNDTFNNTCVVFSWEARLGDLAGEQLAGGETSLDIDAGCSADYGVRFEIPSDCRADQICMVLYTRVGEALTFLDEDLLFRLVD